jgi:hypothetical protein
MQSATMTVLSGPLVSHFLKYLRQSPTTSSTPRSRPTARFWAFSSWPLFTSAALVDAIVAWMGLAMPPRFFILEWLGTSGFLGLAPKAR